MAMSESSRKRAQRVRHSLKKVAAGRPRLSVYRSSKHIYAQIIDDLSGCTLASASSLAHSKEKIDKKKEELDSAVLVGRLIAKRAQESGINKVVFDRGSYIYHGRVKALAEAARDSGLIF